MTLDWRPYLLRPDAPEEGWALPESIRGRLRSPDNPLTARAEALGLTLVQREHIPSTRRAHECTEYARAHGRLAEFHHAVLKRYWARGEDLHDWAVLRNAAGDAGLDADAMQREVSAGQWRAAMQEGLDAAAELGVTAVPTFIVQGRLVIRGAEVADTFRQALARLGVTPRAGDTRAR